MNTDEIGNENRVGKIIVAHNLIYHSRKYSYTLFAQFIPIYVSNDDFYKRISYIGFCEKFDIIKEGDPYPEYEVIFRQISQFHSPEITFNKINHETKD